MAGGIGITPILGMALQLAQRGAPLRMLYAARCADELIYRDTGGPNPGQTKTLVQELIAERTADD